jgi:hypothetical protein
MAVDIYKTHVMLYLGLQSIGLVKHDGEQDQLFDEDEDQQKWQSLVVFHGSDDFE